MVASGRARGGKYLPRWAPTTRVYVPYPLAPLHMFGWSSKRHAVLAGDKLDFADGWTVGFYFYRRGHGWDISAAYLPLYRAPHPRLPPPHRLPTSPPYAHPGGAAFGVLAAALCYSGRRDYSSEQRADDTITQAVCAGAGRGRRPLL